MTKAKLYVGSWHVPKFEVEHYIESGSMLALLNQCTAIEESGAYWIDTKGVPKNKGYYIANCDGTFSKVSSY
ncbi:MAG: hypothetical protein KGH62_02585, partial [Candidatus Micrarchaeota archaeon]|nr:hypothetical protein [Candidatus Micrarchaeota archaeon]